MSDFHEEIKASLARGLRENGEMYLKRRSLAQPTGSGRSSAFFTSDVCEAYDYVLDQASMYRDQASFAEAVAEKLRTWAKTAQNSQINKPSSD